MTAERRLELRREAAVLTARLRLGVNVKLVIELERINALIDGQGIA
jgi:hypothetical protein